MGPIIMVMEVFMLLTGPGGQVIRINPHQIVETRVPRNEEGHFAKEVQCLVFKTDSKFTAVKEDCETVEQLRVEALNRERQD